MNMVSEKRSFLYSENLSFTYKGSDSPALKAVSFSLQKGEFCGLIGPNGAGKTTLISLLTTLLRPDSGVLAIDGVDGIRYPERVREKIGLVPQDLALYDRLTGLENILFFGKMYGLQGKMLREKAHYYLDMFGLHDTAGLRVSKYSGGMKRRLNLIAGLLHDPDILFLDEPTVGIDAQSRHLIIEKLADLNQNSMTMVYTSHYIEEVEKLCRRVVIIDEGQVVAEGHPEELVRQAEGCEDLGELFLRQTGEHLRG